jgi:hypothetical protein
MEDLLMNNEMNEPNIPHKSNDVSEKEREGNPDVCSFQSRDTIQYKDFCGQPGTVGSRHDK